MTVYHLAYLIGVKVSNPFAADQGSPFFLTASCMLRAVMSIARTAAAVRAVNMTQKKDKKCYHNLKDGILRWLLGYHDLHVQ